MTQGCDCSGLGVPESVRRWGALVSVWPLCGWIAGPNLIFPSPPPNALNTLLELEQLHKKPIPISELYPPTQILSIGT